MYKKANKFKLRFQTSKGLLSAEQLEDLSQVELANSIKAVKKILKKTDDDELSFLEDTKTVDVENQLRFDILKDIYLTKQKETEERRVAAENKVNNEKIIALIAEKREEKLKNLPEEDLLKLLK